MTDRKSRLDEPRPSTPSGDDRVADTGIESLLDETEPSAVPDEERTVPEDVDVYVADDYDAEI